MKVQRTHPIDGEKRFEPVTIAFTFENQDELDAMGAIFIHVDRCGSCDFLDNYFMDGNKITKMFRGAGADCNRLHPKLLHKLFDKENED